MFDRFRVFGILMLMACSARAAEPRPLSQVQLNLEEGFQFAAKIVSETVCVTDVDPEQHQFSRRHVYHRKEKGVTFLCTVTGIHPDGDLSIRFQYEWIKDVFTQVRESRRDVYDSADPNRGGWATRVEFLDALVGRSFVARVSSRGTVRDIEGFADLYHDLYHDVRDAAIRAYADAGGKIALDQDGMRQWYDKESERTFREFFARYWPLSEASLKETVQQLFFVWPGKAVDREGVWHTQDTLPTLTLRRYNTWTLTEQRDDWVIVDFESHTRTDLNLCDANAPTTQYEPPWVYYAGDILYDTCRSYRDGKQTPMYAGDRRGFLTADPKSGLIDRATWTEELSGICPSKVPALGWAQPVACPSRRTEIVTIEIARRGK